MMDSEPTHIQSSHATARADFQRRESPIVVGLAGDVMLGRIVNSVMAQRHPADLWGDLLPALKQLDLFLINLECALTNVRERWSDGQYKAFYFRADPAMVGALSAGRVNLATVANNHIGDFGVAGLLETLDALDRAGIAHAGAGRDLDAARSPGELSCKGVRISVIALADYPEAWAANTMTPGLNFVPIDIATTQFRSLERSISTACADTDFVIVSAHWGPNMRTRPTPAFRAFARRVIESGADVFWGHSAHIAQGVEFWRRGVILYDTGDFVDDYAVDAALRNDLSALFVLRIEPGAGITVEALPVQIAACQVNQSHGDDRAWFLDRFQLLCQELGSEVVSEPNSKFVRIQSRSTGA